MVLSPMVLAGVSSYQARLLEKAGIITLGILREFMKDDFWTWTIKGIGLETGKKITLAMYRKGLIDESFEDNELIGSKVNALIVRTTPRDLSSS